MCLAVPGQITAINGDNMLSRIGKVSFAGVIKEASLALLPEANVGDYILVHAGFAITLLNEEEAKRSISYFENMDTGNT